MEPGWGAGLTLSFPRLQRLETSVQNEGKVPPPLFLLFELQWRYSDWSGGRQLLGQLRALLPPHAPYSKATPPRSRQHALQSFGSSVMLPNPRWGRGTQAWAL